MQRSRVFLPSVGNIIFVAIFFHLSLSKDTTLLGDGDTGYHIRAGEYILANLRIPDADIFSYLNPPLSWTLHEWLSEVLMAIVHRFAGLTGITVLFAFIIALTGYLVFVLLMKPAGNLLFATIATLLVVLASASNWLARPHALTFLIFVIWYRILHEYQSGGVSRLFLLPILMIFWVNLHGGFILGLILLAIYAAGNLAMSLYVGAEEKKIHLRRARDLSVHTASCGLVALVNPYGYEALLFPFRVVGDRFLMDHIAEYLSPNFHASSAIPFEILLLGALAIFALSKERLGLIELALVLLFGHMALFSSRHMPLFAIIATPILLRQATIAFRELNGRAFRVLKNRFNNLDHIEECAGRFVWPIVSVVVVAVLAFTGTIRHSFDERYFPKAAVDFLRNEPIAGNMFNNDEFGDYLIYAAWPAYKVFLDGRTDMYGAALVREYLRVTNARAGWEDILNKYKITWIFQSPNTVLSKLLLERADWKLVYADAVAHIYVKTVPQHQKLLSKYPSVRPRDETNSYAK